MGEEECSCFNNEVESCGPLATRFNLRGQLWASKRDLSSSNTPDAFVNAVDVMERAEDGVKVDQFAFDECIPLCRRESSRGARGTSDPSLDGDRISLDDVEDTMGLVTTLVSG